MADATEQMMGLIPMAVGVSMVERIMGNTPKKKKKKSKGLTFG